MEDLNWSINHSALPGAVDNIVGSTPLQIDQTNCTQNTSVSDTQTKNTAQPVKSKLLETLPPIISSVHEYL